MKCEVAYTREKILLISCLLPPNGASVLSITVISDKSDFLGVVYDVIYKFYCVLKTSKVRRHVNYIKVSNLLKTVDSLGGSRFRNFAKKKCPKKPLKTCSMNWGEVNPFHVYYIIFPTSEEKVLKPRYKMKTKSVNCSHPHHLKSL